MRWLANRIMFHRANAVLRRIESFLPRSGIVADIGSGSGHNAHVIRQATRLAVQEYDVVHMQWVGPGAKLFSENYLPVADGSFDASLLLYVLQYPTSPELLLREAGRVSRSGVIVIQSTCQGNLGRAVLGLREFVWGRLAFHVARLGRIIEFSDCPLTPQRFYARTELIKLFEDVGFTVTQTVPAPWAGLGVSRDLFLLESPCS